MSNSRITRSILSFSLLYLAFGAWLSSSYKNPNINPDDPFDFGVDVTSPIHYPLKGDSVFKRTYEKSMAGCYAAYSRRECDATEFSRMEMNLEQTKSQHNYTEVGFKKMRVPKHVWDPLIDFYNRNKDKEKPEMWPRGNTYVNHWDAPSTMISFEDRSLRGGVDVKQQLWDGLQPIIEEWVGHKIKPTSLYGIRSYKTGSILATHVDRMPLVSSCIINVDQDVDEPWFAELYSHDGKAHNVTMDPGDLVLYESATTLHGRPFPLKGRYYANVFVHYIPLDHYEMNDHDPTLHPELLSEKNLRKGKGSWVSSPARTSTTKGGHEHDNHDAETYKRHFDRLGKEEEARAARGDSGEEEEYPGFHYDDGRTALHSAAGAGDLEAVTKMLSGDERVEMLHARDANDWQPIYEAARGGHLAVLKYLVGMGADVAAKTSKGGTPLYWARRSLETGHPMLHYLESIGAPEEGAEDL